jgi:hypothetical protein
MAWERWSVFFAGLAVAGVLLGGLCATGSDTEEQLVQRIQSESNPVKKAKAEIKLARLRVAQVQEAYSQGHIEAGTKYLAGLLDTMKTAWRLLRDSGRKAPKQPDGFRDLEIALREDVRTLEDLQRKVSYFDRAPVTNAAQELEQIRSEVIHALFPGGAPRTSKGESPAASGPNPANPAEAR